MDESYEKWLDDLGTKPGYATLVSNRNAYLGMIKSHVRDNDGSINFRSEPSMASVCAGFEKIDRVLREALRVKEATGRIPRISELDKFDDISGVVA